MAEKMKSSEVAEEMKIRLKSSSGDLFEISKKAALMSETLKRVIEDGCAGDCFPVPNVNSKILVKVIKYCTKHSEASEGESLLKFDAEFMDVDQRTLLHLTMAANYLQIESLLELTTQTAANLIKGRTPEQIRQQFNIKNDFGFQVTRDFH